MSSHPDTDSLPFIYDTYYPDTIDSVTFYNVTFIQDFGPVVKGECFTTLLMDYAGGEFHAENEVYNKYRIKWKITPIE